MPKRSGFAIALGLHAQPDRATTAKVNRSKRAAAPRNAADGFYFQLEAFLDEWRHLGVAEEVVRAALERARRTSLAMENVGYLLLHPG